MFKRTGCYATILPEDIMVISLNAIHFSVRNRAENDPEAPPMIFAWLERKLEEARREELRVFLTYHIPHGVFATPIGVEKFWVYEYEDTFKGIVKNYSSIISGIFTGHIHISTFNVSHYQVNESTEYYAGVLINRAVSPIFGNNPGFSLLHFIDSMEHPKYYEEYTFPLVSTYNRTDPPETFWMYLYSSYKDLHIKDFSSSKIHDFLQTMGNDMRIHLKYMVLRLGKNLNNFQDISKIIIGMCKDYTEDKATYTMCLDSLSEYANEDHNK